MRCILLLCGFVFLAACQRQSAPPPTGLPVKHEPFVVPFTAKWVVSESSEGRVALTARIEKSYDLPAPIKVSIQLPEGVTLARGAREYQLGIERGVDEKAYELTFSRAPEEDVVLSADVRTTSLTAHGEDRYRFGRPAPQVPLPVADGPEIRFRGKSLGRPVMADQ